MGIFQSSDFGIVNTKNKIMGEQSGARSEGDRYQHLYSWYVLLQLLNPDSEFDYGYVEHPEAGAADDVTLHPKFADRDPAKFYQVKWHVDLTESYTYESLATVKSGKTSLIEKLFKSWKKLKGENPIEVWLVSNWQAAPEIGRYIRERGHKLTDDFFICGAQAAGAKGRKRWKTQLGATEEDLHSFCRDLRLRLGFAGISDLEEMVDDRMARYGLKTGENWRSIAIDEVRTWIELGGANKKITRDTLLEAIERRDLTAPKIDQPQVSLFLHGWAKRAFDQPPTVELDWTQYFDRRARRIPDQETWERTLLPELLKAHEYLSQLPNGNYIDLRGKLPLSIFLAVGAEFPEVAGFKFRAEQPTHGENFLWRSDTPASNLEFTTCALEDNTEGENILIGLSISGDGKSDIREFYDANRDKFSALIYAEPTTGTGNTTLKNAADAVALANHAKELIRNFRKLYKSKRTHLILFAPATFCLFLGQRLNAIGRIVTYERTADEGYQQSITISTT